jgi:hypothetical protein
VQELSGVSSLAAGLDHSLAYSPPPPTVSAIAPNEGPRAGGTSVTITGTELTGASAVKFGATAAASFSVNSESSITAVSPPGTGTVDVTVTTPGGTSATSSADQFTYVQSAVEGLPEFGRCVKSAPKQGEYRYVHCNVDAAGKGTHNWLPGPGPNSKFKSVYKAPALQTTGAGKTLITCVSGAGEGQYSGVKSVRITKLVLSGCAISPASGIVSKCQNIGAANGEIEAKELVGELGFIASGPKPKVGLDLKAASGAVMASFECGGASEVTGKGSGTGMPREIEGSVIGKLAKLDTMVTTNTTTYEAKAGHQVPESLQGGVKDTLTTLVGLTKTPEATTLATLEEVKSEEAIEVRDKLCKAGVCVS